MRGVLGKVLADLRRRRLQTAVLVVLTLLASGVATMALTILTQAGEPYDRAFAQQQGAHLLALSNASKVTPVQLQATARQPGITATGGPWPAAELTFEPTRLPPQLAGVSHDLGLPKVGLRVIGRNNPGGPVDRLQLVAGRWATAPGEIVLTRSFAEKVDALAGGTAVPLLGARLRALDSPHTSTFVVVGEVIDVNEADANNWNPQQAWVRYDQIASLTTPNSLIYEMGYRFSGTPSGDQVQQHLSAIEAALPPGALYRSYSYLEVRTVATITTSLVLTFLLAFSIFALVAVALIVANVVTGTVLAGYREIGIMKAIGFTPGQVVEVLTGQMVLPALVGCLAGVPLGALLSTPMLDSSAHAMGLPAPATFAPAMDLLALAGVVLVVAISAIIPAWRAGRLSAVHALTLGTAPEAPRRSWLGSRLQRLGLSRPLSLGAGEAFVRPLRGSLTAIAILIGVATMTFAYGLHGTLEGFNNDPALHGNDYVGGSYQVEVDPLGKISAQQVMRTLQAQPQTAGIVAFGSDFVSVPGIADPVQAVFVRGDATRLGYRATEGRWFAGPGEAVAAAAFVDEAHLKVGDTFTAAINGRPVRLRLVGTDFDLTSRGRVFRMDWSNLARVQPLAMPAHYAVQLRPGTDPLAYGRRVLAVQPDRLDISLNSPGGSSIVALLEGVVAALALILALIAVVGVFNTVLLTTRERIRDTAVLKTLGMSPRQAILMVTATAVVLGITGGVLGAPAGVALHHAVLGLIGALTGNTIPMGGSVFSPVVLPVLALAGVVIAIAGALLPARWAARTPVVEVLHAE